MRRLLALVLALTVAGSSAAVSSMHVHAYGGHDHHEHQHGPASHRHDHDHQAPAIAAADHHHDHGLHGDGDDGGETLRIEACNAGDHEIRMPRAAAPLPRVYLQLAVLPGAIAVAPATPIRLTLAPIDVRVHGPPPDTRLPARAPPQTFLA